MKWVVESLLIKITIIALSVFISEFRGEELLNTVFLLSLALFTFRLIIFVIEGGFFHGIIHSFTSFYQQKDHQSIEERDKTALMRSTGKPFDSLMITSFFLVILTIVHSTLLL